MEWCFKYKRTVDKVMGLMLTVKGLILTLKGLILTVKGPMVAINAPIQTRACHGRIPNYTFPKTYKFAIKPNSRVNR